MVGAVVWSSVTAVAGPVQIISQDRRVTATASPGAGADPVIVNVTAPDNGPFEETAAADASGEGFVSRATSSVRSTMGNDGFHIDGTLSWETQDTRAPGSAGSATADASVFHDIFFRLDEAYDFTFSLVLNVTENNGSGGESGEGFTALFFVDEQGSVLPGESGTLQPGDYNLRFNRSTESTVSGDALGRYSIDYAVNLNLMPSDGSSEPNPIPLPPAAWAGLGTFACYGASRVLRQRCHAA